MDPARVLILCALLSGCGTVAERVVQADKPAREPYAATRFDAALTTAPLRRCNGPECGFIGDALWLKLPAALVGLVGLPISVVVDTLLLPVDLSVAGDQALEARSPPAPGE